MVVSRSGGARERRRENTMGRRREGRGGPTLMAAAAADGKSLVYELGLLDSMNTYSRGITHSRNKANTHLHPTRSMEVELKLSILPARSQQGKFWLFGHYANYGAAAEGGFERGAHGIIIPFAVKTLAKRPALSKDPRQLQFEADINRLFLYSSYNRLGKSADEADAEKIIEMASKTSFADQQTQVQENVHSQIETFCAFMDEILLPNEKMVNDPLGLSQQGGVFPRRSGLSFAVGRGDSPPDNSAAPQTRPLSQEEVSQKLKDQLGYTLNVKPSHISHKDAGQGLFLDGAVDVGAVVAFYPGVVYSPAYYRYIPGYPKVGAQNPYLITRYDGNVINAQPWGSGGDKRELWNGRIIGETKPDTKGAEKGSDRMWKMLSKPLEGNQGDNGEVIERRNPLALAHFANHPPKGMLPNVMICPYDFPLTENNMRVYIPNILFGNAEVNMRRFGSFWFKSGVSKNSGSHVPTLKSLVLIATRALQDEELLLNYRLSNTKRRPEWYDPVDEEEDRRRWS